MGTWLNRHVLAAWVTKWRALGAIWREMGAYWHALDANVRTTIHLIPKREAKVNQAGGQATEPHQPIVQATRGPTETKPDRTQPAQPQKTLWEKKEPSPTKRRSQGPSRTRSECTVY